MTTITRTETDAEVTYTLTDGAETLSTLVIDRDARWVLNVETSTGHERQGYARALWEHANAEAEVFHALPHHRTAEGDAFAEAMGGDTIDEQRGYVAECCICTDCDDEE